MYKVVAPRDTLQNLNICEAGFAEILTTALNLFYTRRKNADTTTWNEKISITEMVFSRRDDFKWRDYFTRRWETLGQVGNDTPGLGQIDHDCIATLGIVFWPGDGESLSKNVTVANGHNVTQAMVLGRNEEQMNAYFWNGSIRK